MSSGQPKTDAAAGPVAGIANRYAGALFELAMDEGAIDAVERDLATLTTAIEASPDLRSFIASPLYSAEEQVAAATAIAEKAGFSTLTRNFVSLVARNRRLFALPRMIDAFMNRLADHRGEISAEAISAAPLSGEQEKNLRREIESIVGKAVNLRTRIDEDLLGGLVVKVGSKMIDSSLRTKLNRMKSVMKEA